jgi:O-antigen/teichoic acid export membrane protein
MWIGLPVFIMTSCFSVLIEFFRAQRRIKWYSIFSVWKSISAIGFGILLVVALHFSIEGLLLGSLVSLVFAFPFLLKNSIGKVSLRLKNIYAPLASELAKYGFPLAIGNLAAWILSLSDRYVLELFRGSQEVGIYSASYAISERSIMLLSTLFALTSGSIVYNIWEKEGKKKSQEFVGKITRYYLLICTPAAVGLSVLSKPIIVTLTGQEYHGGNKIISIVVFGFFFLGLQQRFYPGFGFYKKTHFIMLSLIVSGLVNLGLNFLLIPRYGFIAAAATTLLSYVFLLVLVVFISRRFFTWKFPFKSLTKVMGSSAIMGIVVYYVGNSLTSSILINLISGICIGAAVYFLILLLLKEFSKEEIQILHLLKQKVFK